MNNHRTSFLFLFFFSANQQCMANDSNVPTLFELCSRKLVHTINWQNPSKEVETLKNEKLFEMDLERVAQHLSESQPQPIKRPDLCGLIATTRDKVVLEKKWLKIFPYIHIVDPNNSQKGIWISKPRNCTAVAVSLDNSHYAFRKKSSPDFITRLLVSEKEKNEVIFGKTSSWSGPITTHSDYENGLDFINHDTFWTRDFWVKWGDNYGFYKEEIDKKRWLKFLPTKKESIPCYASKPAAISPNQEFKALFKFLAVGCEGPLFDSSIVVVYDHDPEFIISEEWELAKKKHKFKKELSHEESISTLAFDPESKLLLASSNKYLYLWDFKQAHLVAKLEQNDPNSDSGWWSNKLLWWSPDYTSVIIRGSDGTIFSVDLRPTVLAYYLTKKEVGDSSKEEENDHLIISVDERSPESTIEDEVGDSSDEEEDDIQSQLMCHII